MKSYANEGLRVANWRGGTKKYHRRIQTYLKDLMEARLVLRELVEGQPSERDVGPELGVE